MMRYGNKKLELSDYMKFFISNKIKQTKMFRLEVIIVIILRKSTWFSLFSPSGVISAVFPIRQIARSNEGDMSNADFI